MSEVEIPAAEPFTGNERRRLLEDTIDVHKKVGELQTTVDELKSEIAAIRTDISKMPGGLSDEDRRQLKSIVDRFNAIYK